MRTNSSTASSLKLKGREMRAMLVALSLVLCQAAPAQAEVSIGVNIGFDAPTYPNLVPVPGYPVYYDPAAATNYFFYDGLYWVYQNDNWYSSSWYNGPWQLTDPDAVPLFVLRVPVRYYSHPPLYFRGWHADAAPHWGQHWGNEWRAHHNGWNHWDHNAAPHAAPLPLYQRQYTGDRYPRAAAQQNSIRTQNYHYQPHEQVAPQRVQSPTQQRFQSQARPAQPAQARPQTAFKPIGQPAQIAQPAQPPSRTTFQPIGQQTQSRPQAQVARPVAPQAVPHPQAAAQQQAQQHREQGHGGDNHGGDNKDEHDHHDQH